MDAIIQVDEPQSCQYVITVLTSKICAIPHLRPPPVHKPVKIECRPLLTSIEYEKYQNYLKVWFLQLKMFQKLGSTHIDVRCFSGIFYLEGEQKKVHKRF